MGEIKSKTKARYWVGVCYPENMVEAWQEEIGDILEYPYAYCIHDKDHLAEYKPGKGASKEVQERDRKVHVHIIVAFPNTTTYNNALNLFKKLSKENCSCINTVQAVENIRNKYEYLIHNTETCKKQKKYLYKIKERITGNNFDIGSYEQISIADKAKMKIEISDYILENCITNYADLYAHIRSNFSDEYMEIFTTFSGHFERLCKGVYHNLNDKNRRFGT